MINITELKDFNEIKNKFKETGDFAKQNGIRITTHPGPFVVLSSPHQHVVDNSITNLELHGLIFDLMGLERTPYNKINIHCNGVYGDKKSAMDRFCDNYNRLSESVKSRLTVENDDKATVKAIAMMIRMGLVADDVKSLLNERTPLEQLISYLFWAFDDEEIGEYKLEILGALSDFAGGYYLRSGNFGIDYKLILGNKSSNSI